MLGDEGTAQLKPTKNYLDDRQSNVSSQVRPSNVITNSEVIGEYIQSSLTPEKAQVEASANLRQRSITPAVKDFANDQNAEVQSISSETPNRRKKQKVMKASIRESLDQDVLRHHTADEFNDPNEEEIISPDIIQ